MEKGFGIAACASIHRSMSGGVQQVAVDIVMALGVLFMMGGHS